MFVSNSVRQWRSLGVSLYNVTALLLTDRCANCRDFSQNGVQGRVKKVINNSFTSYRADPGFCSRTLTFSMTHSTPHERDWECFSKQFANELFKLKLLYGNEVALARI